MREKQGREGDFVTRAECKRLCRAAIQQYHIQLLDAGMLVIPESMKAKALAQKAIIPATVELVSTPRIGG